MKQFKIRASSANKIMAEPRAKNETLSQGAKTYCKEWLTETIFNRREEIKSRYIDKGNQTEEEALNLMVRVLKTGMLYKNEERKSDEYKAGECDIVYNGTIIDNKSSYSLKTFPIFEDKLNPDYYAQVQVYMDLWKLEKSKIVYTLNNTPIEILSREVKWLENDNEKQKVAMNHVFTEKYWKEVKETLFPNADKVKFTSIEDVRRVKVFDVAFDSDYINRMNIKVKHCREYIEQLKSML